MKMTNIQSLESEYRIHPSLTPVIVPYVSSVSSLTSTDAPSFPPNSSNAPVRASSRRSPRLLQEWALEDPSPRALQLFSLAPTGVGARHRRAALDLGAFVDQLLGLRSVPANS